MGKTVTIPEELYEALTERANSEGLTLTQLVQGVLEEQRTPELSPEQLLARLKKIPPLDLGNLTSADIIREGREERTDQILDAISRR